MNEEKICRIIEGALFASETPLTANNLASLFDESECPDHKTIQNMLQIVMDDYAERGIELKELASGFQFQVKSDLSPWISRLWDEKPIRYSHALLETLALIAYRQPITRGEISDVRGVGVSSNIIRTLLEREWIRVVGHRDVPGKPALYATTKQFLDDLGLKSLSDLPTLSEIKDLNLMGQEIEKRLQALGNEEENEEQSES